jgi:hypothetical protein
VIAKRIIDAAKNGERDPARLRNAGLVAFGFDEDGKQASKTGKLGLLPLFIPSRPSSRAGLPFIDMDGLAGTFGNRQQTFKFDDHVPNEPLSQGVVRFACKKP